MGDAGRARWALLLSLLLVSCSGAVAPSPARGPGVTITVAAAADLRFALDEIILAYEAHNPDVDVVVTYGSSGSATSQIENGAPFDVFFSADIEFPRRLERTGLAAVGATREYALGRVVVWVRSESTIDVETLGLAGLMDESVRSIAIANPTHAPYGRAAVAAMRAAGVYAAVADRLVLGENVSQAAQFVGSGSADIGIIALSLALAPTIASAGRYFLIPDDLHPPIDQGVVVLDRASNPHASGRFVDHVLGDAGRHVLERYGFTVPDG